MRPPVAALVTEAERRGVAILPECGLDPGIDLVLMAAAADNALKYRISWTFAGVLRAYRRAGRVIRGGELIEIGDTEQFAPHNTHALEIDGLGCFEAYPNGDALPYVDLLGLDRRHLRELGRFTLRWPGHCAFWRTMVGMGLLDDEPVVVKGVAVDRRQYLAGAIAKRGLLSPVADLPYPLLAGELAARNIRITRAVSAR